MQQVDLDDKTIVITGASSGVGKATALKFATLQASLVLAARNESALNDVAQECRQLGASVLVVPTDVTDPKAVIGLANAANDWKGYIDVWINNAGILAAGDFDKTPIEVHEQVIKTNLLGYMNGAHAVLPFFKAQKFGILINNISIGGYLPVPYGSGYTASKFGLRGFTEALKAELTAWPSIYVCDLFPAFLDTPGIQHAGNYTGKQLRPASPVDDPDQVALAIIKIVQNPRSTRYIGRSSLLLKFSHALFPELLTNITGFAIRRYFQKAEQLPSTSGNVFNTVDYGMSVHGGWNNPRRPIPYGKYIAAGFIAGVAAAIYFKTRTTK
ncbi:MAG: family oxidoreductase [Mucilaginibacter sp.]|nr:family oxidoreductase [Mucilaginibacter sp.]